MGGELFLAAVGGCLMSNLLAAIKARGAAISQVSVEVVGSLAEPPTRYQAVKLQVAANCEDRVLLERLVDIADRGCIMTNTLRPLISVTVCVA
jgi:putative redox protein